MNSSTEQWLYHAALREELLKEAGIIPQGLKNLAGKIGHAITTPVRAVKSRLNKAGDELLAKAVEKARPIVQEELSKATKQVAKDIKSGLAKSLNKEVSGAISKVKEVASGAADTAGAAAGSAINTHAKKLILPYALAATTLGGGVAVTALLLKEKNKRKQLLERLGVIDASGLGKK